MDEYLCEGIPDETGRKVLDAVVPLIKGFLSFCSPVVAGF
jgi:hypothetical protein